MTPTGLSAVSLKTRAVERVVEGRVNLIMLGKKTGRAYYVKNRIIYSVDLETKATTEIAPLPPNGSIASVNADETLLAGAITDPSTAPAPTAATAPGQWICLFRPEELAASLVAQLPNAQQMIMPGRFKTEKLVNLSKHDYNLEPNVTFSPDMKWVVFRSNKLGPTHVYAVEVAKANNQSSSR